MKVHDAAGRRLLFVMAAEAEYGPHLQALIDPLICGVGPIEAAAATAAALQALKDGEGLPDLVVSLGSAGSARCEFGVVHQVSQVSWRDIDASLLGFPKGVTPFLDRPARIDLPTPLAGVPTATLSTGAKVIGRDHYAEIDADLVDMETFAVLRACERFGAPLIGLRGVSDGHADLQCIEDWQGVLHIIDEHLAQVVALMLGDPPFAG